MMGKLAVTDKHTSGGNVGDLLHSKEGRGRHRTSENSHAVMRSKGKEFGGGKSIPSRSQGIEVRGSGTMDTA